MTTLDLAPSRAKLSHARQLLIRLQEEVVENYRIYPLGVLRHEDLTTGGFIWYAQVSKQPPIEWSVALGDIVHNARASLDYLAWQLELANGNKPGDHTSFRVADPKIDPNTPHGHEKVRKAREKNEKSFGIKATDLMDKMQPILPNFPGDRGLHPFHLLHELDRWDKHRVLNVIGGAISNPNIILGQGNDEVHIDHMEIGGGPPRKTVPIEDGTELLRLKFSDYHPLPNMDVQFDAKLVFDLDGPGKGLPVFDTCSSILNWVSNWLTIFAGAVGSDHDPLLESTRWTGLQHLQSDAPFLG